MIAASVWITSSSELADARCSDVAVQPGDDAAASRSARPRARARCRSRRRRRRPAPCRSRRARWSGGCCASTLRTARSLARVARRRPSRSSVRAVGEAAPGSSSAPLDHVVVGDDEAVAPTGRSPSRAPPLPGPPSSTMRDDRGPRPARMPAMSPVRRIVDDSRETSLVLLAGAEVDEVSSSRPNAKNAARRDERAAPAPPISAPTRSWRTPLRPLGGRRRGPGGGGPADGRRLVGPRRRGRGGDGQGIGPAAGAYGVIRRSVWTPIRGVGRSTSRHLKRRRTRRGFLGPLLHVVPTLPARRMMLSHLPGTGAASGTV